MKLKECENLTYDICALLKGRPKYYDHYFKTEYKKEYTAGSITSDELHNDMIREMIETLLDYDEEIFPNLFMKLLHFLMYGEFMAMEDIVVNQLREGIHLKQRRRLIAECNKTNEVRVSEYAKKYYGFVIALMNSEIIN